MERSIVMSPEPRQVQSTLLHSLYPNIVPIFLIDALFIVQISARIPLCGSAQRYHPGEVTPLSPSHYWVFSVK